MGSEALVVFYGENIFKVYLSYWGEADLKKFFAEANIGRVRKMEIITPSRFGYPPFETVNYKYKLDSKLWSPFLANLTKLSIVVQQPLRFRPLYPALPMKRQLKWLRVTLQDIASHLTRSCIVEVDDNDSEETRVLMGESFPGGYRKVQTLSGDVSFGRNDYWSSDEQSESSDEDDLGDDQDDDDDNDDDGDDDGDGLGHDGL